MTGIEHYGTAEQHIQHARASQDTDLERLHLQYAQTHATLALVAVTADAHSAAMTADLDEPWNQVVR